MKLNIEKRSVLNAESKCPVLLSSAALKFDASSASRFLGLRFSADGSSLAKSEYRAKTAWCKWRQVSGVMCDRKFPL